MIRLALRGSSAQCATAAPDDKLLKDYETVIVASGE